MTSLDLNQQPLCVEYPTLDVDFELKTGLIRLLPTFRGLAGEDPHKHLKEFHVVCSGMRPQGVTEEQVKLRAFPFSLGEKAKDWLYSLPSGSIVSWNELKKQFLENYFPASRTITIRKEISGYVNFPAYCRKYSTSQACGICTSSEHSTDACPTLHEEPTMHVNTVGGFSEPSQRGYDPFSKTYNPGWRDHPKLRYDNASQNFQKPPPPLQSKQGTSLEDMMKTLIANTQQFQQDTRTSIQNLENQTRASIHNLESQVSQLASSVSRLESRVKKSYNSKIALGVGTYCKTEQKIQLCEGKQNRAKQGRNSKISPKEVENSNQVGEEHPKVFVPKPPFPERFAKSKKEEEEKEILETFTQSRENAMCDLGASINVMPLAIYESLNVGPLKETGVVLQLADRFIVYPDGVLEDVLVQINELVFPADFYVLDMMGDNSPNSASILLGRPFLKTSKTKIDVDAGILSMEFDNEVPDSTNSSATAVAAPIPATGSTPLHRAHRRHSSTASPPEPPPMLLRRRPQPRPPIADDAGATPPSLLRCPVTSPRRLGLPSRDVLFLSLLFLRPTNAYLPHWGQCGIKWGRVS
ncbi:UNVERIFIED_CONTAM: hypothetical protein Sradi_1743300 [Sesamum radiatum]|uniref:Retrotransposon gag domain-containing protein n=1 Tax=Sesamum radiatum TaxID=300843 RepID=A0AAW2TU91_SESRA